MIVESTPLEGCFIINPNVYEDERGYFYVSYNAEEFEQETGVKTNFVQDNIAKSEYGVVRGLHIQRPPFCQAKLVTCLQGRVLDVVVDVRKNSKTYGEHFSIELNSENRKQLFVPRGFLHGYSVLYKTSLFAYKCDNDYNQAAEDGVNPMDKTLNIDWKVSSKNMLLSEKDKNAQAFDNFQPIDLE